MTWYVIIDEAGDLGSFSKFFTMSAIITKNSRNLKPVFKTIPNHRNEPKFSNSTENEIKKVLRRLSYADISIVNIMVNKHDYNSNYYQFRGNKLYHKVLSELLDDVFKIVGQHDVNLLIDRSTFISIDELRSISSHYSVKYRCNLKRSEKITSNSNKCIQIADYVVGSFYVYYEHGNDKFVSIICHKIIPAYRY